MSMFGVAVFLATAVLLIFLAGLALGKLLPSWEWIHQRRFIKPLGVMGILGGLGAIFLILRIGDTFGFPGSSDYLIYERFNRSMAFVLGFQLCAILAFVSANFDQLRPFSQKVAAVLLAGWLSMGIGTAVEFWLFSGLPYAELNLRSFSFSLFSMGSLIVGISMLILGIGILWRRSATLPFGFIFVLYLPLEVALFIRGDSIFLTPAVGALLIGLLAILQDMRRG